MLDDARRFDMDAASLAHLSAALDAAQAPDEQDALYDGVWPDNTEIVSAFLSVASQWRVTALSHGMSSVAGGFSSSRLIYIGLDYCAVRVALEASGVTITPDLWRGIQTMEFAATKTLNKA